MARGFSASADVIKNSAQFKITNKFSLNDKNIDPDKNCIGELMGNGDKYYLEDDFNKLVKSDTSLSLLHVNARSLNKNRDM